MLNKVAIMRNFLLFLFLIPFITEGQETMGTVIYETRMTLNLKMDGQHSKAFKDMIPKERSYKTVLNFKGKESMYEASEDEMPTEISHNEGNAEFVFKLSVPDNKIYHNWAKGERIERKDFLGKYFLISGEPVEYKWKITGNMKTIAGYNCQEATYSDTTRVVSAWFTPEIAISAGPGNYGQLPGLILEVDVDNGNNIIQAQEIRLEEINNDLITPPNKGKKVSQREFDEIEEKKLKEMGQHENRKGGMRMIITEDIHSN